MLNFKIGKIQFFLMPPCRVQAVLNSNEDLSMDHTFQVNVGVIRDAEMKGAGKHGPMYAPDPTSRQLAVHSAKSMVSIPALEGEYMCAARSMITGVSKIRDSPRRFHQLIHPQNAKAQHKDSQRGLAIAMHMATHVPADAPVPVREIHKFEKYLNAQAVVISGDFGDEVVYVGAHTRPDKVFMYLKDHHYDCIVDIDKFLPRYHWWCNKCMVVHTPKKKCSFFCRACSDKECRTADNEPEIQCDECNLICRGQQCYDRHKRPRVYKSGPRRGEDRPSMCQTSFRCTDCNRIMDTTKRDIYTHSCTEFFCRCCSQWAPDRDHRCYYRIKKPKKTSGHFIFYDVETTQDTTFSCGNYANSPKLNCTKCTNTLKCHACTRCKNCLSPLCNVNKHLPNFIVAQTVCDSCKDTPFTPESTCFSCGDRCQDHRKEALSPSKNKSQAETPCTKCSYKREQIFKGADTTDSFCKWLVHPVNAKRTVLAHNGRNFDHYFILQWCVEHGIFPEVTFSGCKIMIMTVQNGIQLKFLDSLNFFGCALKYLPRAMGLSQGMKKGTFPYGFNKSENFNYIGPMPPKETYFPQFMSPSDREEFLKFYQSEIQRGAVFDFQKEILDYTREDVNILRESCMQFRALFREITTMETPGKGGKVASVEGSDCFASATIASCAMQFLRQQILTEYHSVVLKDGREGKASLKRGQWVFEDTEYLGSDDVEYSTFLRSKLPQTPVRGYTKHDNDSNASMAWLDWISFNTGRPLMHARNGGEYRVPGTRYRVDGWDPVTGQIFEYLGCFFHRCLACTKDPNSRDPHTGKTNRQIYDDTQRRLTHIRSMGYEVTAIWECQFARMAKNNPKLKEFLKTYVPPEKPLQIRESLYGGRVCPTQLYYKAKPDERILYYDVKSLYPFCNFTKHYPTCHPEVIKDQSSMDYTLESHEGIAKVTILPPRGLYLAVLPFRCNGRLKFPLCAKCAEKESSKPCRCSDADRSITGVYTIMELKAAIKRGYKLTRIHEIYNYSETAQGEQGIFHEYVTTFLAVKEQAGGFPSGVTSESDKDRYVEDFYAMQGIKLDKEKVERNPGLRFVAKIFLNSIWGKFCENSRKSRVIYVKTMAQYAKIINDPTITLSSFHVINNDIIILETKPSLDYPEENRFQNELIGAYTTSHARLHLLEILEKASRSLLYFDTDSLLFHEKANCITSTVQEGYLLGDLVNELPENVFITEFVSSGPKSYAYKCSDNTSVLKIKGITRNYTNSSHIDFDVMKKVVFDEINSVTLPKYTQICRDKYTGLVYNRMQTKTYKKVFTKRAILPGSFDTVPFGY